MGDTADGSITVRDIQVRQYCTQYLQLEPSPSIPDDLLLRETQVQEAIFQTLFADGAVQYGPPARYQLRTLKELVGRIEGSIDDWDEHGVSENLMSALAVLLVNPLPSELVSAQQKCYVSYHQSYLERDTSPSSVETKTMTTPSPGKYITILENRSLLSAGGTTGLRTWEAALHLGQYLCKHKQLVEGKRVLELGAGTGYLSILCAKYLDAAHVVASDGSDDVINNLPDNFFLNSLQDTALASRISAMDLKWGHALVGTEEKEWDGGRGVDVVLGADITYDQRIIPALVGTIEELFDVGGKDARTGGGGSDGEIEVYVSAMQRNWETFGTFLKECRGRGLAVEELGFEVGNETRMAGPYYTHDVEIKLCRIARKT